MVQAAGTDLWNGFRGRVAEWFGRGDAVRESRELERLDRSASELSTAGQDEVERLRVRHEAVWQSRIETLLEDLDGVERDQAVAELSKLMAQARPSLNAPFAQVRYFVWEFRDIWPSGAAVPRLTLTCTNAGQEEVHDDTSGTSLGLWARPGLLLIVRAGARTSGA